MTVVAFPPTPLFEKELHEAEGDYEAVLEKYFDADMNPLPDTPEELVRELDSLVEAGGDAWGDYR